MDKKDIKQFPYLNLTPVQRVEQYLVWKKDPCQFINDCCVIPEPGKSTLVNLYPPQRDVIDSFFNDHFLIFLKSRQIGISLTFQCLCTYLVLFYPNLTIGICSKSKSEASKFSRKIRYMLDNIPYDWMKPKSYPVSNVHEFSLSNGSTIVSQAVPPANPTALFRGQSLPIVILDEWGFTYGADAAWTSVAMSLSVAQPTAKKNGIPYGTVIISTPNKKTGMGATYYNMWQNAVTNPDDYFKPIKIHWSEIGGGRDEEWYKNQCAALGNDENKIAQELDMEFVGDSDSVWPVYIQKELNKIKTQKVKEIKFEGEEDLSGSLWIFKEPSPRKYYILGVDTAGGSGKDYSTVEIIDFESNDIVAEYIGKLEPKIFAKIVKMLAGLYKDNLIVIENSGGFGTTVINELQFDKTFNYNLYGEWKDEQQQHIQNKNLKRNNNKVFILGLNTNSKTRPLIIESMYNYVKNNIDKILSERLAFQLLSLIRNKNKVEADKSANDDLVLALALATYVRDYAIGDYVDQINQVIRTKNVMTVTKEEEESFSKIFDNGVSSETFSPNYIDSLKSTDTFLLDSIVEFNSREPIIVNPTAKQAHEKFYTHIIKKYETPNALHGDGPEEELDATYFDF